MAALSLARCAAVAIVDARQLQQRPTGDLLVAVWPRRLSAVLITPVHSTSLHQKGQRDHGC